MFDGICETLNILTEEYNVGNLSIAYKAIYGYYIVILSGPYTIQDETTIDVTLYHLVKEL